MPNSKNAAYWLASIISRYAASKNVYLNVVFASLRQSGALDFLVAHYDVLHLDDPEYVLEDINAFVGRYESVR